MNGKLINMHKLDEKRMRINVEVSRRTEYF